MKSGTDSGGMGSGDNPDGRAIGKLISLVFWLGMLAAGSTAQAADLSGTWRRHWPTRYTDFRIELSGRDTVTVTCVDEGGDVGAKQYNCKGGGYPVYFRARRTVDGFSGLWHSKKPGPCAHLNKMLPISGRLGGGGVELVVTFQNEGFNWLNSGACASTGIRSYTETWTRLR